MPIREAEARREYQRRWMRERRAAFFADKVCVICGASDELELHHVDPNDKVDHKVWSWSAERRTRELAKCVAVCHPCHVEHHRVRPTHCDRGHEFTPENTYFKACGRRECRRCRADRRVRVAA